MTTTLNATLNKARIAKDDEFYTQLPTVSDEMHAYFNYNPDVFRDKTILLPADDPEWSAFTKFFAQKFDQFGIRKLISTSFNPGGRGKVYTLTRETRAHQTSLDDLSWDDLKDSGDFRSSEVTAIRDEVDMVITNPPFSLFIEFIDWITEANKDFSVIGSINNVSYNNVSTLICDNKVWLGATGNGADMVFGVPPHSIVNESYAAKAARLGYNEETARRLGFNGKYTRLGNACWFTNIEHGKRHLPARNNSLDYNKRFMKEAAKKDCYTEYDNYDAIEVPYVKVIPSDYDGIMGVPLSYLHKHCPEQHKILGITANRTTPAVEACKKPGQPKHDRPYVNGRRLQARIFIRAI